MPGLGPRRDKEKWNIGTLEYWVYGKTLLFSAKYSIIPVFQEFF